MAHNQEAAQLHEKLQETKAKWAELHDVVIAIAKRESAFEKQINNLKANLCSKNEEANAIEEKRAKMEERLKRIMEKNRLHSTTNVEHDSRLSATKDEREQLQAKIDKLQAKIQDQEDSLIFEKTYVIYHMKKKT
ncbi:probable kinetochore protein SPC25 [Nicotiana tomentosiformis]|uniref:probable kinetochore protein SPC25 n=1 Tax=Nicotiana tomentosiformis TaxID=4098 RepID=UPI00388CBB5C